MSAPDPLAGLWEAGRKAWPGVTLPLAAFREAFAERSVGGDANAADLYLACACANGEPSAIAAFEKTMIAEVPAFLARVEADAAVINEVTQLVRERALVGEGNPRIAEYSGMGRLASWLRIVALRVHADLLRGRRDHAPLDDELQASSLVAPELAAWRERHRADVEGALRAAFASLTPRERTLLRYHYLEGISLERLATLYGVHRASVARWLAAARQQVLDNAAAWLQARLGVRDDELSAWFDFVRSGLQASLGSLLASR